MALSIMEHTAGWGMDEGVTSRRTYLGAPDPGDQHLSAHLPSHGAAGGHSLDMLSLGLRGCIHSWGLQCAPPAALSHSRLEGNGWAERSATGDTTVDSPRAETTSSSPGTYWPGEKQTSLFTNLREKKHTYEGLLFSVAKSCPTLRDPMDCSTPVFPVLHHLPHLQSES